jgi:amino acid transporter
MTNVSMTLPYIFLGIAYPMFKRNNQIDKPFQILKSNSSALFASILVILVVGFANFFTIIQPAIEGDYNSTIWMIAGPIFFSILALLILNRSRKQTQKEKKIA